MYNPKLSNVLNNQHAQVIDATMFKSKFLSQIKSRNNNSRCIDNKIFIH